MRGGPGAWTLSRAEFPVRAVILHHTGGWYGARLAPDAEAAQEVAQLDALARDHRQRFGIGPGYHYVAFPSGRLYAVGKWGTHRAHTKGRNPETGNPWNRDAIGVVAMGDYERTRPALPLLDALRGAVAEVRRLARGERLPVHAHGLTPTVDGAGGPFPQATACPGRHLLPLVLELNGDEAVDVRPVAPAAVERRLQGIEREVAGIRRELGG